MRRSCSIVVTPSPTFFQVQATERSEADHAAVLERVTAI